MIKKEIKVKIKERDIFNFVFAPDELREEIFEYISNNREQFAEEINLLNDVKNLREIEDPKLTEFAKLRLKEISGRNNIIKLHKQNFKRDYNRNRVVTLAADSMELKKKIITETFMDIDSRYLLKLLVTDKLTKLFLFANDNTPLQNLKLTLHPSGKSYKISDNSKPLEIDEEIIADSATIETFTP